MDANLRKPLYRVSLALAFCVGVAACASVSPTDAPSLTKARPVGPAAARDTTIIGKTKRDVLATLGQTASVTFDSGYEIWVYHLSDGEPQRAARWQQEAPRGQAEFVVLFDPSGVVTKTRVRPAPVALSQASR